MISFNQDEWLKQYFEINTELRKKAKNEFEKDVFKRINNAVFGKTMENIRKHRDNKLFTTERRKNYLMLAPNYYSTKFYHQKRTCFRNQPVCLGLSISDLSKTAMHEFWYDYIKLNSEKAKLGYMDTDSFIVHVKPEDIYKDIARDAQIRFDASNYEIDRLLPMGKI